MNMTWVEHLICTDMTGNSAARRRTPTTVETGGFLTHVVDAPAATCGGEANFRGNSCFYFCAYGVQGLVLFLLYSYEVQSNPYVLRTTLTSTNSVL